MWKGWGMGGGGKVKGSGRNGCTPGCTWAIRTSGEKDTCSWFILTTQCVCVCHTFIFTILLHLFEKIHIIFRFNLSTGFLNFNDLLISTRVNEFTY